LRGQTKRNRSGKPRQGLNKNEQTRLCHSYRQGSMEYYIFIYLPCEYVFAALSSLQVLQKKFGSELHKKWNPKYENPPLLAQWHEIIMLLATSNLLVATLES
jgi:hypothetical protein